MIRLVDLSGAFWSLEARWVETVREAQGLATAARKALPSSRAQSQSSGPQRHLERTVPNG